MAFCEWLLSLSIMLLRFLHIVGYIRKFVPFVAEQNFIVLVYHNLFIPLPVDEHLYCPVFGCSD